MKQAKYDEQKEEIILWCLDGVQLYLICFSVAEAERLIQISGIEQKLIITNKKDGQNE